MCTRRGLDVSPSTRAPLQSDLAPGKERFVNLTSHFSRRDDVAGCSQQRGTVNCTVAPVNRRHAKQGCDVTFAFLASLEVEDAPIDWESGRPKDADLVSAAVAAGLSESEVDESPVGVLSRDWSSFRRGARALVGINGSTLLEVVGSSSGGVA